MNHQKKTKTPPVAVREFVALHLVPNVGAHRIRLLLQAVEHPQLIFRLEKHELESINGIGPKTAQDIISFNSWDEVDQILEKTERTGAKLMTYWDEDYPPLLREIYDPPILLWIKGNRKVLSADGIAVVGTRRAGKYGLKMARKFSLDLVESGLSIVSGMALGIDGAAHRAALEGGGKTVAVLGSGIDVIYPQGHAGLAADIINSGGAIISEFPLGTKPDAGNFPVRNRIVSGMTLGTLVIASGKDGGSMITATSALDQNREVFVIPHELGHPNAPGCNGLIKEGMGKLVENAEDILAEIKVHLSISEKTVENTSPKNWKQQELDELSVKICEALEENPLHIDHLVKILGMESYQLLSKLLELEMKQCVRQTAGKNFELI